MDKIKQAGHDIYAEMQRAIEIHGWLNSPHEAWGVIEEEWLELRDAIKGNESKEAIYEESVQLAAMALEMAVQFGERPRDKVGHRLE